MQVTQERASTSKDSLFGVSRIGNKRSVATAYGVSLRTVDNWVARKIIPSLKISPRLLRFDLDAVRVALAQYEVVELNRSQRSK